MLGKQVNWEDGVPEPVRDKWSDLRDELSGVDKIKIPRAAVIDHGDIHVFCDKSQKAYGAIAYIVSRDGTSLLTSKCKVTRINCFPNRRSITTPYSVNTGCRFWEFLPVD